MTRQYYIVIFHMLEAIVGKDGVHLSVVELKKNREKRSIAI